MFSGICSSCVLFSFPICVGSQSLDQKVPDLELLPLAEVVTCFEGEHLPVSVVCGSPSLIRVLDDNRADGRRCMVLHSFNEDVFLQCFRQSHQDVFGMLEVTTALEYVIHRLKGSLYEDSTEDRPLLRKCIREGSVAFSDLRDVLNFGPRFVLISVTLAILISRAPLIEYAFCFRVLLPF